MKATKLILWAVMAVMAVACQANESKNAEAAEAAPQEAPAASQKTEAAVRQRVEAMKLVEYKDQDQILTKSLMKEIAHAHSIFNISESDLYVGFEWAPGIMDVCGDKEPEIKIDKVSVIDENRAFVDMLYHFGYKEPAFTHFYAEADVRFYELNRVRERCGCFEVAFFFYDVYNVLLLFQKDLVSEF